MKFYDEELPVPEDYERSKSMTLSSSFSPASSPPLSPLSSPNASDKFLSESQSSNNNNSINIDPLHLDESGDLSRIASNDPMVKDENDEKYEKDYSLHSSASNKKMARRSVRGIRLKDKDEEKKKQRVKSVQYVPGMNYRFGSIENVDEVYTLEALEAKKLREAYLFYCYYCF